MSKESLLFGEDWNIIRKSLDRIIKRFSRESLNIVEIGVHQGGTSKRIIDYLELAEIDFNYYGIDPGPNFNDIREIDHNVNHVDFLLVNKMSYPVPDVIPDKIHWVFVDGCHCEDCVRYDLINYSLRLVPSGEILFHDAAWDTQGRDPQNYSFMSGYHDDEIAAKGIAVRKVLSNKERIREYGLQLIQPSLNQEFGGVEVYRKV